MMRVRVTPVLFEYRLGQMLHAGAYDETLDQYVAAQDFQTVKEFARRLSNIARACTCAGHWGASRDENGQEHPGQWVLTQQCYRCALIEEFNTFIQIEGFDP